MWTRGLLLIVSVVLTACYFEPHGTVFTPIEPRNFDQVSIDLVEASDSIILSGPTVLKLSIKDQGALLTQIKGLLNGQELLFGPSLDGTLWIDPFSYQAGFYELEIRAVFASNNGSLADRLGAEVTLISRKFVVEMDIAPPNPSQITQMETKDGRLTVHWSTYAKKNFSSYVLTKRFSQDGTNFAEVERITIFDRLETSFVDSSFVGGHVQYQIETKSRSNSSYSSVKNFSWIPESHFELRGKEINYSWGRPKFENTRRVIRSVLGAQSSIDKNDTTFTQRFNPVVGMRYPIQVTFESRDPSQSFRFSVDAFFGQLIEFPKNIPKLAHPTQQKYYCVMPSTQGVWYVLDTEMNILSRQDEYFPHERAISRSGNYFVTAYFQDGKSNFFDTNPDDLSNLDQRLSIDGWAYQIFIADNGLLLIRTLEGVYVYNLNSRTQVFSDSNPNKKLSLSPAGDYLLADNQLYFWNSHSYQLAGNISIDESSQVCFLNERECLISYDDGTLKIWDTHSVAITRAISVGSIRAERLSFDPVSNRVLFVDFNSSSLVNPATGALETVLMGHGGVVLLHGYLYVPVQLGHSIRIPSTFFE